ncbi:uncharacterized protein CDV56_106583 [Aspergillus thermomutatus]|uniref:Major facilitator superfamily (MFS) profile domain-containing protein n=1 Tax=Aspergillus thermomutatus TaxID=41047 RepID=A0A397GX49_ASPTH|nr:uncharacterized protein CDV56_106583 [Aspergillus thermomutatus]RHZ54889.1 hypothetical protein CDV56_106583 [Aspergillus thermomutatus]
MEDWSHSPDSWGVCIALVPNIRTLMMIGLTLTSVLGMVLMYAPGPSNQAGRMAGFCLSLAFSANMPLALSLITGNVGGYTKKAVVNACVLVMYCVGNITGPQFFSVDEAPNYPRGVKASLVGLCLGAFWIVCLRAYLMWQNARRERTQPEMEQSSQFQMMLEDKTDWEIPRCPYVL